MESSLRMKFEVDLSVYENGRRRPEYTLETDINGEISLADLLEFTKSALIITADEVLKDAQSEGFDKSPVVVVDGRTNKPVSAVNPLGSIEFVSRVNVSDLLIDAYEGILGRSPVLTGRYKSSHYVFLNGTQVANDLSSLKAWIATNPRFTDKDLIRFVNIQPYGRKLERLGVTSQRQQARTSKYKDKRSGKSRTKMYQPNGTYFLTARALKSKYKRNSSIKFGFISGGLLGLTASFKKSGRPGKGSSGRPYLYPTITISLSERGVL